MKNKKIIIFLIILLSITVIGLTIFMINMLNGNSSFIMNFNFSHKVSDKLVLDEIYENNYSSIDIKSNESDIYLKKATDDKVRVVIYGDQDGTSVDSNNNTLSIVSEGKKCIGFCFYKEISKIEVYIPSDQDGTIEIENNYGNVKIDEFLNLDISVDEDCGDVTLLGGNKVDITNSYGDVVVEQANEIKIKSSSGDVEIGTVNDITIENDYGDITIDEVTNYLNISEDCGDVEIDELTIMKDSYITNNFGDIEVGSTNEIYINASTDLGDTKVRNNYPKSDITLKIENDCGDIEVTN